MMTSEVVVAFVHGVISFVIGFAVFLEIQQRSTLYLRRYLKWLAVFGLSDGCLEWADMFWRMCLPTNFLCNDILMLRIVFLPLPGFMLILFGAGLLSELSLHKFTFPKWLALAPAVVLTPAALLVTYALTTILTAHTPLEMHFTAEVWTRYLLYFPGCLLAGFGFLFQHYEVRHSSQLKESATQLRGAAVAFFLMAFTSGLLIPPASTIWSPFLARISLGQILMILPFTVWDTVTSLVLMYFVIRALNIFKEERARALEELNLQCAQAQQHAENWTHGLVNIGRQIANMENTDDILLSIVRLGRSLLIADVAALAIWDETGAHLNLKYHLTAAGSSFLPENVPCPPLVIACAQQVTALRYPDEVDESPLWHCAVSRREAQAAAVVPLQLDNRPLGAIWLERFTPRAFTPNELIWLSYLADQTVIALEHALMAARIQSVAILEERSRIAREMHDGLAQILGYLSLELQTLEALTQQDHKADVLAELCQARQRVKAAQADVRESILSLRTTLAGNSGVLSALRQYCEEFELQTGMQVQFVAALPEIMGLSSLAEVQLICIIREAFVNIQKHARATQVKLELDSLDNQLTAMIADDGCGFAEHTTPGHFGLQIMRERAQSVGGELEIASCPGQGTHLRLRLPLAA